MKFLLEISMDDDELRHRDPCVIARLLVTVAQKINAQDEPLILGDTGTARDVNGNIVLRWKVEGEFDERDE